MIFEVFWEPEQKFHDFPRKKKIKIENPDPSRHWILVDLAVGKKQKKFHKNIEENNSAKKKHFFGMLGQNVAVDPSITDTKSSKMTWPN